MAIFFCNTQKYPSSFSLLSSHLLPPTSKPQITNINIQTQQQKTQPFMEKPFSKLIEVTVISAEGLLLKRKQPVKKNAFVTVRSDPFNSGSTGVDSEGGSYPAWNQKLVMELPRGARFITVEAHSGSRLVGTANVPVADFAGGNLPDDYLSFLSYRIRDGRCRKTGIVNISVKVRGREGAADGCATASCSGQPSWGGAPVIDGRGSGRQRVVTGIPLSYGC